MEETSVVVAEETKVEKVPQVHLIARDPQQMAAAQSDLTVWIERKLTAVKAELTELENARDYAKAHKWNYKALANQVNKLTHQVPYYEKMLAAVNAGFTLIPNFPIDLFAIRVYRDNPTADNALNSSTYSAPWADTPRDELPDTSLAAGLGTYVNPSGGKIEKRRWEERSQGNNGTEVVTRYVETWRTEFAEVEFPLIAARPIVMEAAQQAMALKVFDQVGICPPTLRKGDPLIIAQINCGPMRYRTPTKMVSFLIAWHLNLNTL